MKKNRTYQINNALLLQALGNKKEGQRKPLPSFTPFPWSEIIIALLPALGRFLSKKN